MKHLRILFSFLCLLALNPILAKSQGGVGLNATSVQGSPSLPSSCVYSIPADPVYIYSGVLYVCSAGGTYVAAGPVSGSVTSSGSPVAGNIPKFSTATNIVPATGSDSFPGNAATASALAATPGQCTGVNFAQGVTAAGVANCAQPSNVTGNAAGLSSYPSLCTGDLFSQGLSSGSNNCLAVPGESTPTPVTITSPQLLDMGQTSAGTQWTKSGANCLLTGVFANGAAGALAGTWWNFSGDAVHTANNGVLEVTNSTAILLTVANSACVTSTATVAGIDIAPQLLGAQGANVVADLVDSSLQYKPGTTGYTLGSSDNQFYLYYLPNAPNSSSANNDAFLGKSFVAQGFIDDTTARYFDAGYGGISFGVAALPTIQVANQPIVLVLDGTTPALVGGNGSIVLTVYTRNRTLPP